MSGLAKYWWVVGLGGVIAWQLYNLYGTKEDTNKTKDAETDSNKSTDEPIEKGA